MKIEVWIEIFERVDIEWGIQPLTIITEQNIYWKSLMSPIVWDNMPISKKDYHQMFPNALQLINWEE